MRYEFETVDVFTDRRFGGNPLAVFPTAGGLDAAQMQAIANEFNLSETTFVLPPKDAAHSAEVRIFTPKYEMNFAGHPNVGTAFVIARRGHPHDPLLFEERAGLVPLEILRADGDIVGARLTAPQPLQRGEEVEAEIVAAACALDPGDIDVRRHKPCVAGCGTVFLLAQVENRQALERAQPQTHVFARHFPVDGATGIHLYLLDGSDGIDVRTRMFSPLHGIQEDPATGSANVSLTALLASLRPEPDLSLTLRIAQGVEMGRPSLLEGSVEKQGGVVGVPRLGGRCVPVMSGTIEV